MTAEINGPVRPDAKINVSEAVAGYLFAERNANVYAILDGASATGLLGRLHQYEPEFECLYRGELAPDMAEVAPYLVRLERKSAFTDWVLDGGWGQHWGIFAVGQADLPTARTHFRRFLTVHDSDGNPMLFRYYDPRVLRLYLPTCNSKELEEFWGPTMHYVLEAEDPHELLRFQLADGGLAAHKKTLVGEG